MTYSTPGFGIAAESARQLCWKPSGASKPPAHRLTVLTGGNAWKT